MAESSGQIGMHLGAFSICQEVFSVKRNVNFLLLVLFAATSVLTAQSFNSPSSLIAAEPDSDGAAGQTPSPIARAGAPGRFSRLAFGAGVSPLGIQFQAATNIGEHLNLRGTGNIFKYSTNFTTNGLTANASLNLASAGVALDVYPFRAGFRISPGVLFYNGNQLTASDMVPGGSSFTLDNQTFYSANTNAATGASPVSGAATLGLNATKPAFTITTGWGNMIPRKGGHWSFPFEIGVALIGTPSLTANLTGTACYDQAQTQCANLSSTTNPISVQVQSDLQAQIATWRSDLNPLKTYPIISGGVAYCFHVR
jgi:hypothetical protein